MTAPDNPTGIPTGPIKSEPRNALPFEPGHMTARRRAALETALSGVKLGAYDREMVDWLVTFADTPTMTVICSWLLRARAAGQHTAPLEELEQAGGEES